MSSKISALTSGNPAQGADEIPINRVGSNFKLTAASIAALAASTPGGSTGQIQYNNTTFAGSTGWKIDNTSQIMFPGTTLAANMTNGYLNLVGFAGTPTGTPAITTGIPTYINTTTGSLFGYYSSAWHQISGAAGSNNQVQYNSSGVLTGSSSFTYNGTTLSLGSSGILNLNAFTILGGGGSSNGLRIGGADSAITSFQIISVPNALGGTLNGFASDLYIQTGASTGNATGGQIHFQTAPPGTSGTSQNSLVDMIQITDQGHLGSANSSRFSTSQTQGFICISGWSGAPVGTVAGSIPGYPLYMDKSIGKLYYYDSGWKSTASFPGGSDTQIQYNSSGVMTGDSNFIYDSANSALNISGMALMRAGGNPSLIGFQIGLNSNSGDSYAISGPSSIASSTNTPGGNVGLMGGQGTGSASGGLIYFLTGGKGSSGTFYNQQVFAWKIDENQNFVPMVTPATNGTRGYLIIPGTSGVPTGTPSNTTNGAPLYYDTGANVLYAYNSSWIPIGVAGSTTQIIYNNAGVLAGAANITTNGTLLNINAGGGGAITFGGNIAVDSTLSGNYLRIGSTAGGGAGNIYIGRDGASLGDSIINAASVTAGTSNHAGSDLYIKTSAGTGTGAGGWIRFQYALPTSSGSSVNSYSNGWALDDHGCFFPVNAVNNANATGYLYFGKNSGTPTSTPGNMTNAAPSCFDSGTNKLWIHNGTAWKSITLT